MKRIFAHVTRCAADKFEKRLGLFELMGCDIMIDTNLKVYLIEMNTNPALFLGIINHQFRYYYLILSYSSCCLLNNRFGYLFKRGEK